MTLQPLLSFIMSPHVASNEEVQEDQDTLTCAQTHTNTHCVTYITNAFISRAIRTEFHVYCASFQVAVNTIDILTLEWICRAPPCHGLSRPQSDAFTHNTFNERKLDSFIRRYPLVPQYKQFTWNHSTKQRDKEIGHERESERERTSERHR